MKLPGAMITAVLAPVFAGCASLLPPSYPSFDDWFIGDPKGDYEVYDLDGRSPAERALHAYAFWPILALRDTLRAVGAPLAYPHYLVFGDENVRPRRPSHD